MSRFALQKIVSMLVTFSMLLQTMVPAAVVPTAAASLQPTTNQPTNKLTTQTATQPAVLAQPLSISRIQSSYQAGSTLVISYTVTNNLPPVLSPDIPAGATVTDTVDILAVFDINSDPNTLHSVVLTDTLTAANFITSTTTPVQNGSDFTWTLPDLPPQASQTFTVTMQPPTSSSDFTDLDTGMTVSGQLWDGMVSDVARTAVLVPDSISATYLQPTIDADAHDNDMLWKAAEFTQDPLAMFAFVQGMGFDPYQGSLRGTRGTLWGEAGNSIDQASLLIAMLRAAGVPARYRHGDLSQADAQTLLASMFPDQQGVGGYLPDGTAVSDPLNDPDLLAIAQDHWWVEAYLPGAGWTDLDPTFPAANAGDSFATPGSNDRIAELPDNLRHKVTLSLEVEQYNSFPIGGVFLSTFKPLTATYATAELASKPLSFGHLVSTNAQGGLAFTSVTHTYTPYFAVDGDDFLTAGDEFQDILSNFPLSSVFTTAEWLTVEVEDIDGNVETFTRELKDLIGLDARLNGGTLNIALPVDNRAFTSLDDAFAAWFLPNQVRNRQFIERSRAANMQEILAIAAQADNLTFDGSPEATAAFNAFQAEYFFVSSQQYALTGLDFAELADVTAVNLEENLRVKLYYDQPRIIITSSAVDENDQVIQTLDLRSTESASIVYPGQAADTLFAANWIKAVAESYHEGTTIEHLTGVPGLTTGRIFDEMESQNIQPVLVTPADIDLLDLYLPDPAAYAYAQDALLKGKTVLIPQTPVLVDGKNTLGWWEIDPDTGIAVSVLENGLHGALIEYDMLVNILDFAVLLKNQAGVQQAVAKMWTCIAKAVITKQSAQCAQAPVTPGYPRQSHAAHAVEAAASTASTWRYLPTHLCPVDGCGVEQFILPDWANAAIPLPENLFNYRDRVEVRLNAGRTITVTDDGSGGPPSLSLFTSPSTGSVLPGEMHAFDVTAVANFNGPVFTSVYAPDGWQITFNDLTGQAEVTPPTDAPAGDYLLQIVAASEADPSVLATAQHTVTVSSSGTLDLSWAVEPYLTIPMGQAAVDDVSGQTNDGEAEIPDSAFRLGVYNGTAQAGPITLTLSVDPAYAGWLVLNGRHQTTTSFNLAANERSRAGLYVLPPTVPPPGTSFTINIQAVDQFGNVANDAITWTMPGQAHNYLQIVPETLYAEANGSVDFDLTMTNVGNAGGSFPITATLPISTWTVSNLQSPISLNNGEINQQTPTLNVTSGELGRRYPLLFASSAPGSYTQYAQAEVQIVSPLTNPIFQASNSCNLGSSSLTAALESLAFAVTALENDFNANGSYDLALRDDVVTAATSVADYARVTSRYLLADDDIRAIANTLATRTDDADITADLSALATAVSDQNLQLCELEEHLPAARFTPYVDAVLLGDAASFSLDVTNQGSVTTTYAITITGLPGGDTLLNPTIAPGDTANLPVTPAPATLGAYDLTASIHPVSPNVQFDFTATAVARLNVVDKFVQVTQVMGDPAFVETGVSSTTLKVEVANIAGVALDVNARTAVLNDSGGLQFTADVPITLLAGTPRFYDLTTVDTSGWNAGMYTITVNLLDATDALVPDGFGFGYFSVGQALAASQELRPAIVAPGTVTTTVIITSEHTTQFIPPDPLRPAPRPDARPSAPPTNLTRSDAISEPVSIPLTPIYTDPITQTEAVTETLPAPRLTAAAAITVSGVFTRAEQDDTAVTLTGTWSNIGSTSMSGGSYGRATGAGNTAAYTFYGSWANIGFLGDRWSGQAELFIDGSSQGVIDLYRHDPTPISFVYDGLITATHTISLTTLGTANPYANSDRVQLDYFDAWDGSPLPQGTIEQDNGRVIPSNGWFTINDGTASGGNYIRGNAGTLWIPFTGDSFTYQFIRTNGNGWTQLFVDGRYLTTLYTWNATVVSDTVSFQGFGPGPHLLQISADRSTTSLDTFTTPGSAPFDDPNPVGSYTRYEEDNTAWLYNGVPYTQTAQTWTQFNSGVGDWSSGDQAFYSSAAGDTAVITVDGVWINLGLGGDAASGEAEIFLDGSSQGVVDLYRHDASVISRIFPNLSSGPHTISVTVQGTGKVWVDYVDVWDGTTMPSGTYSDFPSDRFYFSGNWRYATYPQTYWYSGNTTWFPFNGDSVTYEAEAYSNGGKVKLFVDEEYLGIFDLFNSSYATRTFSFDGFGSGLHLLRVQAYRGTSTLISFTAPGSAPFVQPSNPTGVIRYEEDDPALLYNGVPYTQTVTSWNMVNNPTFPSRGYAVQSATAGDTVSLTFDGAWAGVGFIAQPAGGQADIYLDGVWQQTIDLYSNQYDTRSLYFDGLVNSSHTISVTVLGTADPKANGSRVQVDFFDVWDGTTLPDGTFEEDDARLFFSTNWSQAADANAGGGGYAQASETYKPTVWFPFTGNSVTYQAWAYRFANEVSIKIDGVSQGVFDIFSDVAMTRTFSFDGLGSGPHVMEVRAYRGNVTVDAFIAPGAAPFYTPPPAPTGIVRYEEDDPALLYNGYPFTTTVRTWFPSFSGLNSSGYVARTNTAGDWVSLDFYGSWAGVGFGPGTGVAEVFIDGSSVITVDQTLNPASSVYFSNLLTTTHTISVTAVSGRLYFDFFDVWDGTQMGNGWFDADLDEHTGPYHYSNLKSWYTQYDDANYPRINFARDGDVVGRSRVSNPTHLWFTFTGSDLTFLPFQQSGRSVEVFIDGVSQGVVDLTPQYSAQPIALYYQNLGDGPHVVHLDATNSPFIDAFQVDPPNFLPYTPVVEWMDAAPADVYTTTLANRGLLSTVGIGDLDGDGIVELVAPASNGQLYVYRGDGQDAGGGSPLLWQSGMVGAAAEPALADLDGDGKAEIIVMGTAGTAAFHADGSTYWFTDTIKSIVQSAGWGGVSVGNLDLDPEPEIVLSAYQDALYVLDSDGTILFTDPIGNNYNNVPVLADITGDGMLDILMAEGKTLTVYDAFNGYNIAWTHTITYSGFYGGAFGAVAVADVDGKQPGGDDGPEVVINWSHYVDVLDADGTFLWNYYFGSDSYRNASPVTIADVDGDNEIEILTASAFNSGFLIPYHTLLVINADGSLLWSQQMGDNTASASGVATQDLDGDGVWEVMWNGSIEGFTILDGPTGTKLFNEQLTNSGTYVDYPAMGDVDGDGYAEVVTGGNNGLYVIGHDGVWGDSRPIWNQHNYHVTNINDDWSVPFNEFNSWDVHNTYRTQTPNRNPAPSYQVALTYTAVLTNITVLTSTASISLTENGPDYSGSYRQEWYQPAVTTTFDVELANMQPGEVRQVSEGVQISYNLASGRNTLTLPPLFVSAPRIVSLSPAGPTVPAGSTAVFDILLTNPNPASSDTYALSLAGIPVEWASYPASVPLAASEQVVVPLTVTVPIDAARDTLPVILDITNGSGGTDSDMALMTIVDGLALTIAPAAQTAVPNTPVTYTLTLTNLESTAQTYTFTNTGLANINLPAPVPVNGGETTSIDFTAAAANQGPQPFSIQATATSGAIASDDAILEIPNVPGIAVTLLPDTAVGGPGSTVTFTVRLENVGTLADTFDLTAVLPAGWSHQFIINGQPVTAVTLSPGPFNTADVILAITPDTAASPANYPVSVTAQAQTTGAADTANGTVALANRGVQISFLSGDTAVNPGDPASWQVQVTNTGAVADTFDLLVSGFIAVNAQFSQNSVTLSPGQSQTVQLSVSGLDFALPQKALVMAAAQSQTDAAIYDEDSAELNFNSQEGVVVAWQPGEQTVSGGLTATFLLVITNTGNVNTTYGLNLSVPGGSAQANLSQIVLPGQTTAVIPVTVLVPQGGDYNVTAVVDSTTSTVSGTDTAVLHAGLKVYLPVILNN